jgi:hypothetical protein
MRVARCFQRVPEENTKQGTLLILLTSQAQHCVQNISLYFSHHHHHHHYPVIVMLTLWSEIPIPSEM